MPSKLMYWCLTLMIPGIAAACEDSVGPEIEVVSARVGEVYVFLAATETDYVEDFSVENTFTSVPEGSTAVIINAQTLQPRFTADMRGSYVVDRRIRVGAADRWTNRYLVEAGNAPPYPTIMGAARGTVGVSSTFNAAATDTESNFEELEFLWTLESRPMGSTAILEDLSSSSVTFLPDIYGAYVFRLGVFDGDDWAEEEAEHTFFAGQP